MNYPNYTVCHGLGHQVGCSACNNSGIDQKISPVMASAANTPDDEPMEPPEPDPFDICDPMAEERMDAADRELARKRHEDSQLAQQPSQSLSDFFFNTAVAITRCHAEQLRKMDQEIQVSREVAAGCYDYDRSYESEPGEPE
jgi:hypothetical protein